MAKPYSQDLRERVVGAVEAGATRQAAGDRFGVSDSSAIRWVQRWRSTGELAAKRRGGGISPLEAHAAMLLSLVAEQPDLTLDEWCVLLRERGVITSRVSVWRFFDRHEISYKKNPARQRARAAGRRRRARALAGRSAHP
jgi:transposase